LQCAPSVSSLAYRICIILIANFKINKTYYTASNGKSIIGYLDLKAVEEEEVVASSKEISILTFAWRGYERTRKFQSE
jgi:hypothetical protein